MSPKTVPHIRCQRCHHKHATHSVLGKILLCQDCYHKTFPTALMMQAVLDFPVENLPIVKLKESK